jgi:hypothetical protein
MHTKLTTAICAALTAMALPATAEKRPETTSGVAAPDLKERRQRRASVGGFEIFF